MEKKQNKCERHFWSIALIFAGLAITLFCVGCNNSLAKTTPEELGELQSFEYYFGFSGHYWIYSLGYETNSKGNEELVFRGTDPISEYIWAEVVVDEKALDELADVLYENGFVDWNGYSKNKGEEGFEFRLIARYANGEVSLNGSGGKYPSGFNDAHHELISYFNHFTIPHDYEDDDAEYTLIFPD